MIIVPIHTSNDKIIIEVIFTNEEKQDELFSPVRESIRSYKNQLKTIGNKIIIEREVLKTQDTQQVLGELVDTIREKYCGDVQQPEVKEINSKTKEVVYEEEDYTKIPQFTLGAIEPEKEPIKETIEPIEEKLEPIKTEIIK